MKPFQLVVALVLAYLLASPVCCCEVRECGNGPATTTHSCCENENDPGDQGPEEHLCQCNSKEPRELAHATTLPENSGITLPVAVSEPLRVPARPITTAAVARHFYFPGSDPPRARLALFSRWLI